MPLGSGGSEPFLPAEDAVNPPGPRVSPPGTVPGDETVTVLQIADFTRIRSGIPVALSIGSHDKERAITATGCNEEGLAMTRTGWTLITATGVCVALLSGALGTSAVAPPRSVQPTKSAVAATPWGPHIADVDAALRARDLAGASAASTEAYRAALASRRWEGLVEAADAYRRIADAAGAPHVGVPRARELYLAALFRARDAGSVEGVVRVAQAFDSLGDRDAADQAIRTAQRMR
jgi:hypothetical protein